MKIIQYHSILFIRVLNHGAHVLARFLIFLPRGQRPTSETRRASKKGEVRDPRRGGIAGEGRL